MVSILIRTVIIYVLLTFSLRIMGKRQIGELDVSELVSTLLISELAAIPIDDPDIPLFNAVIPMIFIFALEIIISTVKNKSERLKKAIDGSPAYIIFKGRLLQNALKENRISVNELLSELRIQGVGDVSEVYYAMLEQNGQLSVTKKNDSPLAHTLVIDGSIMKENLKKTGYGEEMIQRRLQDLKREMSDVFLMTITDSGDMNIIYKDGK